MTAASLNLIDMLEVKMTYGAERQKILAQNIASVDTPGYRAQDLTPLRFDNVLAAQNQHVALAVTDSQHMSGMRAATARFRSQIQGKTFERTPVGNTVVVEEQMMKVAQNATDYQTSTSLYKKIGSLFKEALGLQAS